jgi:hypothetical protein
VVVRDVNIRTCDHAARKRAQQQKQGSKVT